MDINQVNFEWFGAMDDATARSLGSQVGNEVASRLPPYGLRMVYTPGMAVRYNRPMDVQAWRTLLATHQTHVHVTINPLAL